MHSPTEDKNYEVKDELYNELDIKFKHNVELHHLYGMKGVTKTTVRTACCTDGRRKKGMQISSGKPEGKRPHGRLKIKWEDYIIW